MKRITLLILALLFSVSGFSQIFSESFEGTTTPDLASDTWQLGSGTWGVFDNGVGTGQSWTFNDGVSTPPLVYDGTRAAFMNRENIGAGSTAQDFLATPAVTIPANGELKFWTRTTLATNNGTLYKIMVAPATGAQNDPGAYALIQLWNEDDLMEGNAFNEYIEKTVDLSAFAGTQVYIAFVMEFTQPTATIGGDRWLVDLVRVVEKCFDPTGLAAGSVSQTSATLTWNNPGGATNSEIYIVPITVTDEPTSGTVVPGNSYVATSTQPAGEPFTPSTQYQYWVRALCGTGPDYVASEWVGPFPFQTQSPGLTCGSAIPIASLPYSTTDNTSNYGDTTDTTQGTNCGATGNYMTGNDVFYSFTPTTTGAINIQMTPTATWSGIFVYEGCSNVGVNCIAGVGNSNSNIREIESLNVTAGQEYIIVISTNATPQTTGYTLIIQQLNCAAPVNLTGEGNGPDNANLSWTEQGSATSWEVFVQTVGSPIPAGPGDTANTNTEFNVTALTGSGTPLAVGNGYQYWVRSDCGDGTFSTWSGPFAFTTTTCTDPCTISFIMTDTFGDSWNGNTMAVIQNGVTVATLTGPTNEDDTNPVTQQVSLCPGPFQLFWNAGGNWAGEVGVSIQNSFGQIIYTKAPGTGAQNSLLFTGEVDCDNPLCLPPLNLTATNVTTFGATLNWTPNGTPPAGWDIYAVQVGQPAPDASTTPTVSIASAEGPPYVIGGLNPDTQYVYYVRAVCEPASTNPWSNPSAPFTTLPTCPKPTALSASGITVEQALITWTPGAAETSWLVAVVPNGAPIPPTTDPVWVSVSEFPYTATGLSAGTEYDVYIIAVCSETDSSTPAGPLNITTPPGCGGSFFDNGGQTANYTNNSNDTITICPQNPGDVVTVTFTQFDTETNWDALYVFDGNSVAAPQIASANGAGNVPGGLPGGYWGNVIPGPFTSTSPDGCLTFTFRSDGSVNRAGWVASITCAPGPTCIRPNLLTATDISTTSALLEWNQPVSPGGTAPASWEIIVVPQGSPVPDQDATGITVTVNPVLITGLNPGTQYTYYIRAICADGTTTIWSAGFNFTTLPSNDECSGAIMVPVNSNSTCNQTVAGTVGGATGSTQPNTCAGTSDDDVWYTFTATNTYHNVSLQGISAGGNLNFAVYSGTCENLTLVQCYTDNTGAVNGLTDGETYFIRVWSDSATPQQTSFTICVSTQSTCDNASNACVNTVYTNTTGVSNLGQIGCLFTSPNPRFFIIEVVESGPISYLLTQASPGSPTPNLDVDYAAWGPFANEEIMCNGIPLPSPPLTGLTTGCSYSAAPTETFNIPNAVAGQFYVILITNFSNQPGVITLTQTNAGQAGAGSTACCPESNFSYPENAYCVNDTNPLPVIATGSLSGTFSAQPEGLVFVDTTTGEINLAASAPGTYVITNTLAADDNCDLREFDFTVTISEPVEATIGYSAASYCTNLAGTVDVEFTGTTGGSFASTPPGLFINPTTGAITPSSSAAGVYTITYNILSAGACEVGIPTATVEIIASPDIEPIADVVNCGPYTLPALAQGNYFDGPGGTGNAYNAGDAIETTMTLYVYGGTGECVDEESFLITINNTPQLEPVTDVTTCSGYELPALTVGNYFTGPNGTGTALNAGDVINTNQTIYVYAADGICPAEVSFTVSVGALVAATMPDATVCDSYELQPLPAFNTYYTAPNGGGNALNPGDIISGTQTVYIYAVDGSCTDESSFEVTVNATPVIPAILDVQACSAYELPALTVGNYYTGPGGTGTQLNAGDLVTSSQTIYVYAQTGTVPNCVSETSFEVSIGSIDAQEFADVTVCDSYTLEALPANHAYWSGPGATGTQYQPGQTISQSMTVYVYASVPGCFDESDFVVTVNATPVLDVYLDVTACDSYTLGTPTVGNYYSGPDGSGSILDGQTLTTSQTVYVYAQTGSTPNCFSQTSFSVTLTASPVVDDLADVSACDSYTLLPLTSGSYYTGSGGTGTQLNAGDVISASQTIYVYAQSGADCSDETSFTVTISSIPAYTVVGGCNGSQYVLSVSFADTTVDASQFSYDWSVSGSGTIVAPATGAEVVVNGAATYSVVVSQGGCEGAAATFEALNTACKIQKGISANNDGENDYFDLEGQDVAKLQIFNRYGVKVYERGNYTNQWYGQSSDGDELPDGTYYYVIDYNAGETKTGWIYINRKN